MTVQECYDRLCTIAKQKLGRETLTVLELGNLALAAEHIISSDDKDVAVNDKLNRANNRETVSDYCYTQLNWIKTRYQQHIKQQYSISDGEDKIIRMTFSAKSQMKVIGVLKDFVLIVNNRYLPDWFKQSLVEKGGK